MNPPAAVLAWRDLVGYAYDATPELTPELMLALIWQESTGNKWAWNPEPRYRWFWDVRGRRPFRAVTAAEISSEVPPWDFPFLAGDRDQEWWAQQASWGLCQVMGAVGRERGFNGSYLTALLEPETSVRIGALHLQKLIDREGGDVAAGLLRYNGGGNARYAVEVLEKLAAVRGSLRV